jgi:hypothetical protein
MPVYRLPAGHELSTTVGEIMRALDEAQTDDRVVRSARDILVAARCGYPQRKAVAALWRWGRRVWHFTEDPYIGDAVDDPGDLLDSYWRGAAIGGDCDDAAALMGALALAINCPVRIVTVSWWDDPDVQVHIWANAFADGMWYSLDVSPPGGLRRPAIGRAMVWSP